MWQWDAVDHVDPVTEPAIPISPQPVNGQNVYDVYHCNSADPGPNGDVLISMRHANALLDVRRSDGKVQWKLGGTPTNKDGAELMTIANDPDGGTLMQHDARFLPDGHVTVFDNRNLTDGHAARGLELSLDHTTHTAQIVWSFDAPTGFPSCCMGDVRVMPDDERVIGWGNLYSPGGLVFSDLDANGNDAMDVWFGNASYASYRVVKAPMTMFDLATLRRTAGG